MGLGLGAGHAEAKIEPGRYVIKQAPYGIPLPEANARVVGNTMYTDWYGIGAPNTFTRAIIPTKRGGNSSQFGASPQGQWLQRTEFHKTPNGYVGTVYSYGGLYGGTEYLQKTTRKANTPR